MLNKSNQNTKIFSYLLAFILLLLPAFSINHSLVHGINQHQQNQYSVSAKKTQYLNTENSHHYHDHGEFCLLCSFWQKNKFTSFVNVFKALVVAVLLLLISNNRTFFLPSFACNFLKTGPPLKIA